MPQGFPLLNRRAIACVFKPKTGVIQQRRDLFNQLRGAAFKGIQGVVQGIDHWQQVNHAPA